MHRREFLIASSMSAALSVAGGADCGRAAEADPRLSPRADAASAASSGPASRSIQSTRVHAALYEPRYLAAREFAQLQVAHGVRTFGTNECIVSLWRGPLAEFLEREEACMAGLTLYSDFAIVSECARDRGLKVLHEGWCKSGPVTLASWLIGT
ncbi:MAG: hypothetical protein WDO68_27140 [Gammaproteobacteria bacterium]